MKVFSQFLAASAALSLAAMPAAAQDAARDGEGIWITLGTGAGPVTSSTRSQPANLLRFDGRDYLVDVGDGAAGQSGKAGAQTKTIDGIFISHLHFDHTAGLTGILGLRFQTNGSDPLTIYGPPGTRQLVDGILSKRDKGVALKNRSAQSESAVPQVPNTKWSFPY